MTIEPARSSRTAPARANQARASWSSRWLSHQAINPHQAKLYDLMMMVMLGGRERTRYEFEDLLTSAGFRLIQIVDTNTPLSVIEATLR
jgi:hypothetical protein